MSSDYTNVLSENIRESIEAKQTMLADAGFAEKFAAVAAHIVACYKAGGRIYIAGNGGSAADAQHLAAEFISKLARDRAPLPAEALTVDSSILTAIGNDYGFEHIFSRQLRAKLQPNDVFLGITTSGKSPNILRALEVCREKNVKSITLTGHDGAKAAKLADYALIVPGKRTSTIQELHILVSHTLCECVENSIFNS